MPQLSLSNAEYRGRRQRILERLEARGASALITFGANNVSYFSRFAFIPTERPIAHLLTTDQSILLVPNLEIEHAWAEGLVDDVVVYPEYPGLRPALEYMKDRLVELGLGNATIGVDADGYGQVYGYRGPRVSDLLPDASVVDVLDDIEYLQMINSEEELRLIRESARWGNLAHSYLQEYSKVGVSEIAISQRASNDASEAMIRTLGPDFRPRAFGGTVATATFRGQVGKASALPHAMSNNAKLQPGDVLGTYGGSSVWGYGSELERTMIVGEPNAEQERFFGHMLAAQTLAIGAIRPGLKCSDIDRLVREYYEEHDLMPFWRHHAGHAKSTLIHEAPFLDIGDEREIEVGMVFTVEPGLYVPDFAGFRHSDTVAVTPDGVEWITYYPRDLESLTIPI
ncbi:MAG: Xaa-Pro peptidase family protein [Chloroflexota bacterium]|nr:Xaa-Pro peptidase family protein [Chloroflexota bacterium]